MNLSYLWILKQTFLTFGTAISVADNEQDDVEMDYNNKTLREEPSLHRSEFPIHVHGPVFMALCRLSRVPWSEVEGQTSPGDEPTVTLAQLHSELSSAACASTTT